MERIEIAALSKIADILSDNNKSPIIPEVDVWKKVFNNAELGDLYEEREPQFIVKIQPYGYGPEERDIYFNENTYNGLFESFKELQYRMDELAKLLNNVAKKMYLYRVLRVDADTEIVSKYCRNRRVDFDEFFESLPDNEQSNIIYKYCNKGVEELRRSLNILGFEIACENSEFCIVPFTARSEQSNFDINIISQWLDNKYPNVAESYLAARKAYANGDGTGCIGHCRNVITGIFTYKKESDREWYSGLQKICHADKNISEIDRPKDIPGIKYNAHGPDKKNKYQYPRFNFINKLYVFTCDLGAHINEGYTENGEVDLEEASIEDALWSLRATEDMLIWIYQTGNMELA